MANKHKHMMRSHKTHFGDERAKTLYFNKFSRYTYNVAKVKKYRKRAYA